MKMRNVMKMLVVIIISAVITPTIYAADLDVTMNVMDNSDNTDIEGTLTREISLPDSKMLKKDAIHGIHSDVMPQVREHMKDTVEGKEAMHEQMQGIVEGSHETHANMDGMMGDKNQVWDHAGDVMNENGHVGDVMNESGHVRENVNTVLEESHQVRENVSNAAAACHEQVHDHVHSVTDSMPQGHNRP